MKSKLRNEFKILSYVTSKEKYKAIFLVTLILALYGGFVLAPAETNFFDALLLTFRHYIFNMFMFTIIILNSINICNVLKKDFTFYLIRLRNKDEYIKSIIRINILMYLFHMLILFLLVLASILLTGRNISIVSYDNYNISNLVYTCFYLFRYLLMGLLISIIMTLIYLNINEKVTITIQTFFLAFFFLYDSVLKVSISKYQTVSLFVWSYFTKIDYPSFKIEVIFSCLMIVSLLFIIIVLSSLFSKRKGIIEV